MADAQFLYAEQASDVTAATTTYVDVVTLSSGSFTASKKYLIIGIAYVHCNNATDDIKCRLVHGTTPTAFTDATGDYEVALNNQRTCVGFMHMFTQPGTPEDIKIQIANIATSTTTCDMAQIYAIKMDDDFVENTDYFWNEVTADYSTTNVYTAQASVTLTANGTDNWLVMAQAVVQPGSATTPYHMTIYESVANVDEPVLEEEGEDITNERRQHLLMRVFTPTAASHTFSTRFESPTTASTIHSSRIFALNLSKFAQNSFQYTAAEDQPSASPTWDTEATLSVTPTNTGDFFILGFMIYDIGNSGDNVSTRLQINASGGGLASNPNYGDDAPGADGWDSADQTPFAIGKILSLSSGAGRTINMDSTMVGGTALRAETRCLVAFSKALAAGGGANTKRSFGVVIG